MRDDFVVCGFRVVKKEKEKERKEERKKILTYRSYENLLPSSQEKSIRVARVCEKMRENA